MSSSMERYTGSGGASMPEKIQYAQELASADLLPANYRKKPGNVLLAVEYGQMLDVHPLTAIQQVHVIEGKLSMSAELMRAQVLRHGHTFRTLEMSSRLSRVSITRGDDPDHTTTVEFTMADAEAAGLSRKDVWKKHPTSMLHARATSMIVRAVCPEVLMGISYTPEEIGGAVDDDGNFIEVASEPLVLATQAQVDRIMELSQLLDDAGRAAMAEWKRVSGVDPKSMTPSQAAAAIIELERLTAGHDPDGDGGPGGGAPVDPDPEPEPDPGPAPTVVDDGVIDAVIVDEPSPAVSSTGGPATDGSAAVVAEAATLDPGPELNRSGFPVSTRAELDELITRAGLKPAKVMIAARDICKANGHTLPESLDRLKDGPLLDEVVAWLRGTVLAEPAPVLAAVPDPAPEAPTGGTGGDKGRLQRRMHALASDVWGKGKDHEHAREQGRKALIRHVSAGRTDSSSECDVDELDTICDFLDDMRTGRAALIDGVLTFTEGAA